MISSNLSEINSVNQSVGNRVTLTYLLLPACGVDINTAYTFLPFPFVTKNTKYTVVAKSLNMYSGDTQLNLTNYNFNNKTVNGVGLPIVATAQVGKGAIFHVRVTIEVTFN